MKSLESLSLELGAKFGGICVKEIKMEIEYGDQSLRICYDKINNSDFHYEIYDRFPHFRAEKKLKLEKIKVIDFSHRHVVAESRE